jgi:hypothetical protein
MCINGNLVCLSKHRYNPFLEARQGKDDSYYEMTFKRKEKGKRLLRPCFRPHPHFFVANRINSRAEKHDIAILAVRAVIPARVPHGKLFEVTPSSSRIRTELDCAPVGGPQDEVLMENSLRICFFLHWAVGISA